MTIQTSARDAALQVAIQGDIDHHSAERIRAAVDQAYRSARCRDIRFDFSQVQFMDSSGIGMLIGRYKLAERNGGKVSISGLGENMAHLFRISGLHKLIQTDHVQGGASRAQ